MGIRDFQPDAAPSPLLNGDGKEEERVHLSRQATGGAINVDARRTRFISPSGIIASKNVNVFSVPSPPFFPPSAQLRLTKAIIEFR